MTLGSFTPFTPSKFTPAPVVVAKPIPKVDKVAEGIKKSLGITAEEEINKTKSLFEELRKSVSESKGKISMELFRKIGELKCCQEKETDNEKRRMTHCINGNMIGRKETEIQERKK
jgi:hypothetical protein